MLIHSSRWRPKHAARGFSLDRTSELARRVSAGLGGAVAAAGLAVLIGWRYDVPALRSFVPGRGSMTAVTAVAFLAIGITVATLATGRSWPRAVAVGAIGALVAALGVATLLEHGLGIDLGIDGALQPVDGAVSGRPSPATAIAFVLTGVSLVLLVVSERRRAARDRDRAERERILRHEIVELEWKHLGLLETLATWPASSATQNSAR